MTAFSRILESISYRLYIISKPVLLLFTFIMVFVMMMQVLCRYVLGFSLSWPEELATFMMAWMTFIGASMAVRSSEHIGITIIRDALPPNIKKFANILMKLFIIAFSFALIYSGIDLLNGSTKVTMEALHISTLWPRLSVPIGAFLIFIHAFNLLVLDILKFTDKGGIE